MQRRNEFVEHLSEVFRLFGQVRSRPMFGGYGVYHEDIMIGLVAEEELYLKVDAASEPLFREIGSRPFEYTKNGVTMKMSYWSAAVEIFDDPEAAKAWATRAYEAALRSRAKSAKRGSVVLYTAELKPSPPHNQESTMAKGEQRSNKMVKKPKKDSSPPQESSSVSTRPTPPMTAVMPKGKLKNKA